MTDDSQQGKGGRKDPLSATIAAKIRADIVAGRYPVGSRLPAEPEFARQLEVSRSTLRESLKLLEGDGLVLRRQRAGTTVNRRPLVEHPLQQNFGVSQLIEGSGKKHGVIDAQIRFLPATAEIAGALELEEGSEVVMLERTRTADGLPVVRTVDHLDARIVQRASAPLLPDVSFYRWLREHCGIAVTQGLARLSAERLSAEVAGTLGVDEGEPAFVLVQVDFSAEGRPVLHSGEYHLPHAFDISVIRTGPYSP
jgi:GntR family transcriptional regulator